MKVKAVIDRFEGHKAVLFVGENETAVSWPCAFLPDAAAEGDILQFNITIDNEATRAARSTAEDLLRQIVKKNQED